jgi:hypothetical protein
MQQIKLMSKLGLALIAITAISVAVAIQAYNIQAADAQAKLPNNSVRTETIVNGQVQTQDIGDGTIQEQDIADGVIPDGGGALPNVHTVTKVDSSDPGEELFVFIACPTGEKAIGGGFGIGPSLTILQSHPDQAGTSWVISVFNPSTESATVFAYAVCIGPSQ